MTADERHTPPPSWLPTAHELGPGRILVVPCADHELGPAAPLLAAAGRRSPFAALAVARAAAGLLAALVARRRRPWFWWRRP